MIRRYTQFVLALLCAPVALLAQITIDEADMPAAGDTLHYSIGFDIGVDVDDTGPNWVWDFSTMFPIDMGADTFVTVGSTPLLYQFFFNNIFIYPDHKATEAVKGTDIDLGGTSFDNLYDYFKNDNGSYKNVGFGATINGLPVSVRRIPIDHVYEFPMNYGDVDSSYSEFEVDVPLVGHLGSAQWRHNEVDGWGSITTPYGTFDALRVRSTINAIDTIYIDALQLGFSIPRPETVEYKWLAQDEGIPVMQINTLFGVPTLIRYKDGDDISTGIEDNIAGDLIAYPNPASDLLTVEVHDPSTNAQLELIDLSGRVILSTAFQGPVERIDVSKLNAGNYMLRYQNLDDVEHHKLMITH